MNRTTIAALVAGSALLGAGYLARQRSRPKALPSSVVPIITPVIDLSVAEDALQAMAQVPDDEVTLVLHTAGGCVASCVLIANALRQFSSSTAVIPYMAMSGGTLIALNATRLEMGASASLSAVDPIIGGIRARHLLEEKEAGVKEMANEYDTAIATYIEETLRARLPRADAPTIDHVLSVFMGDSAPHDWPIRRSDVIALGLPVYPATRSWGMMVDSYRRRWW